MKSASKTGQFIPTHVVFDGLESVFLVRFVEEGEGGGGSLYTKEQWQYYLAADWELSPSGELLFRGRPVPKSRIWEL